MKRIALASLVFACASVHAAEKVAADAKELAKLIKAARPGDVLVLKDGEWKDAEIKFYAKGTESQPVTLKAQTPGKVMLTGKSRLNIGGTYAIVDGLLFTNGFVADHVIQFRDGDDKGAEHCTLRNTAVLENNPPESTTKNHYVSLYGKANTVEGCTFRGKNNEGPTLVVWVEDQPNEHRVVGNLFTARIDLGNNRNGGETIRVGTSQVSMNSSKTLVEGNVFFDCDGEAEIISNKSCDNVYRGNTFLHSRGALVMRHGNRCVVENNIFLGEHKPGCGGIRMIGEDHVVRNNYLYQLAGKKFESALPINDGIPNSKPNEYFQVKRARYENNSVIDCAEPLRFGVGYQERNRIEPAIDCIFTDNLFDGIIGDAIVDHAPENLTASGNVTHGVGSAPGKMKVINPTVADPMLKKDDNGLMRVTNPDMKAGADVSKLKPLSEYDVGVKFTLPEMKK